MLTTLLLLPLVTIRVNSIKASFPQPPFRLIKSLFLWHYLSADIKSPMRHGNQTSAGRKERLAWTQQATISRDGEIDPFKACLALSILKKKASARFRMCSSHFIYTINCQIAGSGANAELSLEKCSESEVPFIQLLSLQLFIDSSGSIQSFTMDQKFHLRGMLISLAYAFLKINK